MNKLPADFDAERNPPFTVERPAQQRVPFVFNSPHSGDAYPASFLESSRLSATDLRRSEDVAVDQLFCGALELGAPMLRARFPRAWLDVNREPFELDPKLFRERLPGHANVHSLRVGGGLGTIPRLISESLPIYARPPTLSEGLERVNAIYRPYHDTLRRLMAETVVEFGFAVLVDCHSMPSAQPTKQQNGRQKRPDIIIGDRYGTACNGEISRAVMQGFSALGYSVVRNKPYAGGFITEHYGRPAKGLHAVQIEINRALYMDERSLALNDGFDALSADITTVLTQLVAIPDNDLPAEPIAAE
ncbi:MAG: N-formylglutamate amidohydrolase [Pseudomonadota bacterium]